MANKSQDTCSLLENERNDRFSSIFLNMPTPMILLDSRCDMKNINIAAVEIVKGKKNCGSKCRVDSCKKEIISWMYDEIKNFPLSSKEVVFKKEIETPSGRRHLNFIVRNILHTDEDGYIVTIEDHTEKDIALDFMKRSFQITKLISTISQRFVGVYDIDEEIHLSLKDIGKTTGADRVYIFRFSDDMKRMNNIHEWCANGTISQIGELQNIPTSIYPWWIDKIGQGTFIHVEDTSKMPLEAVIEKVSLQKQHVKALMVLPLRIKEKIIGFFGLDYVHSNERWSNYDLHLLKLAVEVFNNVFEGQAMETKLKKSEEKYRKLVETSPDAILLHDGEKIIFTNEQGMNLFGAKNMDLLIGKDINFFMPHKEQETVVDRVELMKNQKVKIEQVEEEISALDGSTKNIEVSATILEQPPDLVIQMVMRDITTRKEIEKKLKQKNAELEEMINKLETTQIHLLQQEKMAGIGQLAAGVAHEINNPLGFVISNLDIFKKYRERYHEIDIAYRKLKDICQNSISADLMSQIGYINQLEKKYRVNYMDNDMKELLNESIEGLERINKIVKGLRIFSRIDEHNELEEFDLNIAIENTLLLAANEIKYYAKIEKNLGKIPLIYGVVGQINQVLLNLIINASHAIKVSHKGEKGKITINTYHKDDYVFCEIIDNGIGMPKNILSQIFNPFFTTKPIGEGTGLGLSISYDIINNKHNGDMKVESIEDVGTKFVLKLPCSGDKNYIL